jgi:hypothetical protein
MQETAPLIAVAFILPAGGCFDVYAISVYGNYDLIYVLSKKTMQLGILINFQLDV